MQRIQPVDPAMVSDKELFIRIEQRFGRVPNMLRLLGNSPAVLRAYLAFTEAFQNSRISAKLRALMTAAIAQISGGDYILSFAYVLARQEGVPSEELSAARRAESSDRKIQAAFRFAACVIREHGHVEGGEVGALKAAGYSDEEVVEMIAFIGLSLFRTYFNLIVDTDNDFPAVSTSEQKNSTV